VHVEHQRLARVVDRSPDQRVCGSFHRRGGMSHRAARAPAGCDDGQQSACGACERGSAGPLSRHPRLDYAR
jgi:hypothetical protein